MATPLSKVKTARTVSCFPAISRFGGKQLGSYGFAAAHHNDTLMLAGTLAEALKRVADGDRAAFEEVYRRTAGKLHMVCLNIVRQRADADDILQDIYCSVWRRADLFDLQRGTAMTWLITIARNRSVDHLRRGRPGSRAPVELASQVEDPRPLPVETIEATQEHQRMHLCLEMMKDEDASAIKAAFFGGSTYANMALAAGIPLGTMKSRMRRNLLRLRNDMECCPTVISQKGARFVGKPYYLGRVGT